MDKLVTLSAFFTMPCAFVSCVEIELYFKYHAVIYRDACDT
jgi:hypothetical protein